MTVAYTYNTPDYIHNALCQIGGSAFLSRSGRGLFYWQDALDFLRDEYSSHIAIIPLQTMSPPYHVFDFILFTPYPEPEGAWKDEKNYLTYYEALEAAMLKCINDIRKDKGMEEVVKPNTKRR
jgi:hypothetical protein